VTPLEAVLSPDGWPYASSQPIDRDDPGRFHALFGRDSLITSLQVMPERPDVARATLRALSALQGTAEDPDTDEEPGKIVHEYRPQAEKRFEDMGWPVRNGELRYYGSADGTSWFLVVLDALGDEQLTEELSGSWRAAAQWLERALERGGGLVRYGPRRASGGLVQQGWRDTVDPLGPQSHGGGILNEDGSVPEPPVADADTQVAALAGLRGLARLSGAAAHAAAAEALATRIAGAWDPDTMAIDGRERPVRGAGSQLGWLLWAGAPVQGAADRLSELDVLTDYGLRTLSARHPQFDAFSYHRGSVWPFDSWLGWAGLRAAGRGDAAERVRRGVLAGVERLGRYPELYAVTDAGVEPIAISNFVQGWTVGAVWALRHEWDGGAHVVA
jgi:glycogen debranching enzyme